jgi:futalosine hydrolase
MLECRGISNVAGNRDKATWRIDEAMAHCHALITSWLQEPLEWGEPAKCVY